MIKKIINNINVLILAVSLPIYFSCSDNISDLEPLNPDVTAPTTLDPTLQFGNYDWATGEFTITWNKASDDRTSSEKIQYRLYYSDSNNIESVESIENSGTLYGSYVDKSTAIIRALHGQIDKYWNVVAMDRDSNIKTYHSSLPALGLGKIDESFANGGVIIEKNLPEISKVTIENGFTLDNGGQGITLDNQGNLLVTGFQRNNFDKDMIVWRYRRGASGRWELDKTFDKEGRGYLTHHNAGGGNGNEQGKALIVNGSSEIYISGASENINPNGISAVIWKIHKSTFGYWEFDNTFASNSLSYLSVPPMTNGVPINSNAADIKIDNNDRLIVGGSRDNYPTVWRISKGQNNSWDFDTSFNSAVGGYLSFSQATGSVNALAVDSQDRFVMVGCIYVSMPSGSDMAVWRINNNNSSVASFDESFSAAGNGLITYPNIVGNESYSCAGDVIIDINDNILISGSGYNAVLNYDIFVWKYTKLPNGYWGKDLSFGENKTGVFRYHDIRAPDSYGGKILRDKLGRIIVTGHGAGQIILRFANNNGLWGYDRTYGTAGNGELFLDFPLGAVYITDIVNDAQGNLVTTGSTRDFSSNLSNMQLSRIR